MTAALEPPRRVEGPVAAVHCVDDPEGGDLRLVVAGLDLLPAPDLLIWFGRKLLLQKQSSPN